MKQTFVLIILLLSFNISGHAAFHVATEVPNVATKITPPNYRLEQMKFYCSLSLKEYEKFRGKKLNFFQKLLFKSSQHRMKQMLKGNESGDGLRTIDKISWLCRGILLGPIAIAMAYIFLKDDERGLIKWAWFGFAGFVGVIVAVLLTL